MARGWPDRRAAPCCLPVCLPWCRCAVEIIYGNVFVNVIVNVFVRVFLDVPACILILIVFGFYAVGTDSLWTLV